jgi:hypothetical protein
MEAQRESMDLFEGINNLSQKSKDKINFRVLKMQKDLAETKIALSNKEKILNEKNIEIVELKEAFARANWRLLKTTWGAWGVLDLFEQQLYLQYEHLRTWEEKCKNYANQASRSRELKAWDFTIETFMLAATNFCKKRVKHYGDTFVELLEPGVTITTVCIDARDLEDSEWRVLGVLWKLLPLPSGALVRRNNGGSITVINDLQSLRSH